MSNPFPLKKLIEWFHRHKRQMPWRKSDDPYKIWVSEIMLQQTRVDQVRPYFDRFIDHFPTVYDLAEASQQEVLKVWEGLGYYRRARNLHHAAQTIVNKYDGNIPDDYDSITELKGVGPYTAAAVLSIAFDKVHAAVDGNVIRVLARFFGIEKDVKSSSVRRDIQELASELIDPEQPGNFNQALMELGALICTPNDPNCDQCPLQTSCCANQQAKTDTIPYKSPSKSKPHKHIGVAIILNQDNETLITLRPEEAMLGGLWEFPGGKQKNGETLKKTVIRECREELGIDVKPLKKFEQINHAYSHFKITLHAYVCRIESGSPAPKESQDMKWVSLNNLDDFPFPRANRQLIDKLTESQDSHQTLLNL